jgi:predicted DNA-binding protein (MmcQ/YjbR family)
MINVSDYCLGKVSAEETYPFGSKVIVYKIHGKIFAITSTEATPLSISLKCDPVRAIILRQEYPEINPGYHLNKVHWNTLSLDARLGDGLVAELIDHSYGLVNKGKSTSDFE